MEKSKIKENIKSSESPASGFPSQRASDAKNVSVWWRHHDPKTSQHTESYQYDHSMNHIVFSGFVPHSLPLWELSYLRSRVYHVHWRRSTWIANGLAQSRMGICSDHADLHSIWGVGEWLAYNSYLMSVITWCSDNRSNSSQATGRKFCVIPVTNNWTHTEFTLIHSVMTYTLEAVSIFGKVLENGTFL